MTSIRPIELPPPAALPGIGPLREIAPSSRTAEERRDPDGTAFARGGERRGPTLGEAQRQQSRPQAPAQAARTAAREIRVSGPATAAVLPFPSSPFMAQRIAQELTPEADGGRRTAAARGLALYRQAVEIEIIGPAGAVGRVA